MNSKDFLSIRDFSPSEIQYLLILGRQVKADPTGFSTALRRQTLAMIFEKPSLRTRVTFDVGIQQLGGFSLYLSPAEINLGKRESVYDVAKNLERMVQGIMIRTFDHEVVVQMARYASIPVINGLTDYSHPCQAMADYLTIWEAKGHLEGLKIAFVGDGNNVARSLTFAGAQLGAHVWLATPPGYELDAESVRWARERGVETGGTCTVTNDPEEAAAGADVVYTDVWASMGQEAEAEKTETYLPSLSGRCDSVPPRQARCHLSALPAGTSRRRSHQRCDRLTTVAGISAGGEPAALAKGNHAGTDERRIHQTAGTGRVARAGARVASSSSG